MLESEHLLPLLACLQRPSWRACGGSWRAPQQARGALKTRRRLQRRTPQLTGCLTGACRRCAW